MRTLSLLLIIAAACLTGCVTTTARTQGAPQALRDSALARELTLQAADFIPDEPERAEALLRRALTADPFHGPAHNNLGVLHLLRGELGEAAGEFGSARRLLPSDPDPRLNLGITLERAGRPGDAAEAYEAALEVSPGHPPALQGLARLRVRAGDLGGRTREMLEEIALRGESERWRDWAQSQLSRSDSASP